MRYFTREWAAGDDESDTLGSYNQFLSTLDPHSDVRRFATSINLNDAWLDKVIFNRSEKRLRLLLLTGDRQVGYWHTDLSYSGVHVAGEDVLKRALVTRPSEIWYDEFAKEDEVLSHSFLLAGLGFSAPQDEFKITFDTFQFSQTPAERRQLKTTNDISTWQ